jgi:membrane protease YdiL (CAAX protease family)
MLALLLSFIWGWQGRFRGSFVLVVLLYFGLGALSHARRHERPVLLGRGIRNLRTAVRNALFVVVPVSAVILVTGLAQGSWHFPSWHRFFTGFPWLVTWAIAQQYGLLCFFYRGYLEILEQTELATAAAAVTFAALHAPNAFLIAVTLGAGVVACMLYRRSPNVIVIGLAHAVLSYLLYFALPYDVTHGLRVGPGYYTAVAR